MTLIFVRRLKNQDIKKALEYSFLQANNQGLFVAWGGIEPPTSGL